MDKKFKRKQDFLKKHFFTFDGYEKISNDYLSNLKKAKNKIVLSLKENKNEIVGVDLESVDFTNEESDELLSNIDLEEIYNIDFESED